jgi:hypothetical protein
MNFDDITSFAPVIPCCFVVCFMFKGDTKNAIVFLLLTLLLLIQAIFIWERRIPTQLVRIESELVRIESAIMRR